MKILLDTNTLINSQIFPEKLGRNTITLLKERNNERYISSISYLEIAMLNFKNRINFKIDLNLWKEISLQNLMANEINIDSKISIAAYSLPEKFHADPFDRIIVATARLFGFALITSDKMILDCNFVSCFDSTL